MEILFILVCLCILNYRQHKKMNNTLSRLNKLEEQVRQLNTIRSSESADHNTTDNLSSDTHIIKTNEIDADNLQQVESSDISHLSSIDIESTDHHLSETETFVLASSEASSHHHTVEAKSETKIEAKRDSIAKKIITPAFSFLWRFMTDGNAFVKVGMSILFLGLIFLFKLTNEYIDFAKVFPVSARFMLSGVLGFGLLGIGYHIRQKGYIYAMVLQGGGLGILALSIYISFIAPFQLISPNIAFALLSITMMITVYLALKQDAIILMIFAVLGGFAMPILISTGSSDFILLFSYYLFLNVGIFIISWFKAWRELNLLGFVLTTTVATLWGLNEYQAVNFAMTEFFLITHFLLYTSINILFSIQQQRFNIRHYVDSSLTFATPLYFVVMQYLITRPMPNVMTMSVFILFIAYACIALFLRRRYQSSLALLCDSFFVLSISALALTIVLYFNYKITSALWFLEACAVLWLGIRQDNRVQRYSAYILQCFSLGLFMTLLFNNLFNDLSLVSLISYLNDYYTLSGLVIGIACIYCAYLLNKTIDNKDFNYSHFEVNLATVYSILSVVIFLITLIKEYTLMNININNAINVLSLLAIVYYLCFKFINIKPCGYVLNGLFIPISGLTFFMLIFHDFFSNSWLNLLVVLGLYLVLSSSSKQSYHKQTLVYIGINALIMGVGYQLGINFLFIFIAVNIACLFYSERIEHSSLKNMTLSLWPLSVFALFSHLMNNRIFMSASYSNLVIEKQSFLSTGYIFNAVAILLVGFICQYYILSKFKENEENKGYLPWLHLSFPILLLIYCEHLIFDFIMLNHQIYGLQSEQFTLYDASLLVLPCILLLMLINFVKKWPITHFAKAYFNLSTILIMGMSLWALFMLFFSLNGLHFTYLPVLNIIDIITLSIIYLAYRNVNKFNSQNLNHETLSFYSTRNLLIALASFAALWLNVSILRVFFHYFDVEWSYTSFKYSSSLQATLSIIWALLGFGLLYYAALKSIRLVWLVGAAILTLVVIKLFSVDLKNLTIIAKVVSFMVIGLLMIGIGYLSPIPPKSQIEPIDSDE